MARCSFSWQNPSAVLEVTGEDAADFLQGQFTNDLAVPAGEKPAVYGLWLNVKGKVLADSNVMRTGDESFLVVSATSRCDVIRTRLEDFIIADDVEVADHSGSFGGFLLFGEGAAELLKTWELDAPEWGAFSSGETGFAFRARDLGREAAWQVVFPMEGSDFWAGRLSAIERIDGETMAARRISSGIPSVPTELGPKDLPNEGGLDVEAVSFTKGCYLGQEVMARLKNLGQVRRRLFVVRIGHSLAAGELTALPAAIRNPGSGKQVGELRSLVRDGSGYVGLAMLQLMAVKGEQILEADGENPAEVKIVGIAEGVAR